MKLKSAFFFIVFSISFSSAAMAASNTPFKDIGRIDIHIGGVVDIHPLPGQSWGLAGCSGATHARIYPNNQYRDDFLAIALTAKHTGTRIMVRAECDSNPSVIKANVLYEE